LRDQLPATDEEIQGIKESIWLNIAAANVLQCKPNSTRTTQYIIFARDDKPFILAGKETVLRAMTIKLYENEINDFYAMQEAQQLSEAVSIDMSTLESTSVGIESLFVCHP